MTDDSSMSSSETITISIEQLNKITTDLAMSVLNPILASQLDKFADAVASAAISTNSPEAHAIALHVSHQIAKQLHAAAATLRQ